MGRSTDYSNISEWEFKDTGYQTGAMVRYQGNIFVADFWAQVEPGKKPKPEEGWALYDELYDVTSSSSTEPAKIIAYIPTWRKKEGFDYKNSEMYRYITHGVIAFLMFSETNLGEFEPSSVDDVKAILSDVLDTGHQNGTKILLALGGATDYGFLNLMTSIGNNPESPLLNQAVQNAVNFVNSNHLDGVDLDLECWWDKNGDASKDQGGRSSSQGAHPAGYALTLFAQKLKQAIPDKLVSAAIFGTSWYGNNYDPKLADYVDWLGVMTYDLTGSWNSSPVGPHSALYKIRQKPTESSTVTHSGSFQEDYQAEQQGAWPASRENRSSSDPILDNPILSVEDALWYWTNPLFVNWQGAGQKLPRNKIAAGVPVYGYDFAYSKEPDDLSGQIPPGYKVIRYKDILAQFPNPHTAANASIKETGSTPRPAFISASGNYPYAHNIYFEAPDTAVAKLNFLKDVGAQGVIIWELSNDVWEEGKSIIKALYRNSGNPESRPALPGSGIPAPPTSGKLEEQSVEKLGNAIKQGADILNQGAALYDAVQGIYNRLEGATKLEERHRSLELLIVNVSKHRLTWSAPYFDSGTSIWGPIEMNVEPGKASLWTVANRGGSVLTGVTGGGKWNIDGTDSSFIIGFCNPAMGSHKNIVAIRGADEAPRWGYDNSENDDAKQFTQSGFYVKVYMDQPKFSPYRRFVYCIADA